LNNSPGRRNQTPMPEETIVNIASMQPSFGEGSNIYRQWSDDQRQNAA
jgi:hypothetical protein